MFCPECRAEFEPHISVCSDCLVPLVEQLPEEELPAFRDLVEVFAPDNQGQMAVAESLLQAAGIPYDVQNAYLQNWVDGAFALGHSIVLGPPSISVPAECADAAHELLAALSEPAPASIDDESDPGE